MSQEICDELKAGLLGKTLAFLKKNVVMMNLGDEPRPTNPLRRFDFTKPNRTTSGGYVYSPSVMKSSVINGYLLASYLPWAIDSGYYIILEPDTGPDIMFTATLDGCAVGYIRADDGAIRVSHHNIQGPNGTDDDAQRRSLEFATGTFHRSEYLEKKVEEKGGFYVSKQHVAIICGVRKGSTWRMYAQVLKQVTKTSLRTGDYTLSATIKSAQEF
jgi:hypothetical protein